MLSKSLLLFFLSALMFRESLAMVSKHFKCRGGVYPGSTVQRAPVPDDRVGWSQEFPEYAPRNYTAPQIHGKPWADPDINDLDFKPKWNSIDENVDRSSYTGTYQIQNGVPLNPGGRTGIVGRGLLGRWGPNHAADPIVTRWKRVNGAVAKDSSNKPILQFVSIKRSDSGEWAIPGGMVDPGEKVTTAAVREFQEEAINSMDMTKVQKKSWQLTFDKFFSEGEEIYRGYVDDRRNTDNSWMETIAYNFHDQKGTVVGTLNLHAGDDAVGVRWVDITPKLKLYANHKNFVDEVLKRRLAAGAE